jgi:hypothetical protein
MWILYNSSQQYTRGTSAALANRAFLRKCFFIPVVELAYSRRVSKRLGTVQPLGNRAMPALLRPADRVTSSKVVVTTTGHEKFLRQAAMVLTTIVASTAVIVISVLLIAVSLF